MVTADQQMRCSLPGCRREVPNYIRDGIACRYHTQFKARHGSHWHNSYSANEIRPYKNAAASWIKQNEGDLRVSLTLQLLAQSLAASGNVEPAQNIKRSSAKARAKIALARLRESGIKPERILAIYLGMCALIEDDLGSHRTDEFRIVQVAKALHRLASGTHKVWDFPLPDGTTTPLHMDVYPKSSGLVLREIGEAVEVICREMVEVGLDAIREAKTAKYGPHPSSLPGWKPAWKLLYEKTHEGS